MEFNLPFFNSNNSAPKQLLLPQEIKHRLAQCSTVDIGETTCKIFQLLQELNRRDIQALDRFKLMELLRPMAENMSRYLNQQVANRPLPLPLKSRHIAQLMIAIESEIALGYKLSLTITHTSNDTAIKKMQVQAIYWALRHLQKSIITAGCLYQPKPKNFWFDSYQLYTYAQTNNLHHQIVKDDSLDYSKKSHVENIFKQICVFSLSRPQSMRMGEAQRVAAFLQRNTDDIKSNDHIEPGRNTHVHVVNLSGTAPPEYLSVDAVPTTGRVKQLFLGCLMAELSRIKRGQENIRKALKDRSLLSPNLAAYLLTNWELQAKRELSRVEKNNKIFAAISLKAIHEAIIAKIDDNSSQVSSREHRNSKSKDDFNWENLNLQNIDENQTRKDSHNLQQTYSSDDIWDQISRGNIISSESLEKQSYDTCKDMSSVDSKLSSHNWQVTNMNSGGYCLKWTSNNPSPARLGELIGLYEKDADEHHWRVGTIRWMQFSEEEGLEIGVQLLGVQALLITVDAIKNRDVEIGFPIHGLMLTNTRNWDQSPSIIVPSGPLQAKDQAAITTFQRRMLVTLGQSGEYSNNFQQFICHLDPAQETTDTDKTVAMIKETVKLNKHQFDELWSDL